MLPVYENLATSSFLLYLDNRLCSNSGFYNVDSQAFPINSSFGKAFPINQTFVGYDTYSFPFAQIICDYSISGANQLSGIYVNNSFITPGQSGWSGTNFDKGQLYFDLNNSPNITSISGSYAVKELNVVLPNFPDITILFESKLTFRPKHNQNINTGLLNNILTYPAVFIENASAPSNKPWMFGGVDQTRSVFDIYLFCDSLYQKNICMGLLKDMAYKYIPLFSSISDFPFNNLGDYKNRQIYNYKNLTKNYISSGKSMFVENVDVTEWGKRSMTNDIEKISQDAFFSLVSVTVWTPRVTT